MVFISNSGLQNRRHSFSTGSRCLLAGRLFLAGRGRERKHDVRPGFAGLPRVFVASRLTAAVACPRAVLATLFALLKNMLIKGFFVVRLS